MNKGQKFEKQILSILLSMALLLSGLMVPAQQVQAEDVSEVITKNTQEPGTDMIADLPTSTVRQMNLGTNGIHDPAVPDTTEDAWSGCYVYYGNYDADSDETAEPVKYRVLDASTTDYSEDGMTKTMLLDCDSVLYSQSFHETTTGEDGKKANDWSVSDIYKSLNEFLGTAFTTTEKSAIANSTKESASASDGNGGSDLNYTGLNGEQIFLLDAKEATNTTYGYSNTYESATNRVKTSADCDWWLRSASNKYDTDAGYVKTDGSVTSFYVTLVNPGASPALNLNLSSVLFSSIGAMSKSSALTSESTQIGTTNDTAWKLTLKDKGKTIKLTDGKSVTKTDDETITVPYTYTDTATTDREKVTQISVMITDEAYGSVGAEILHYGALQDVTKEEGTIASSGTGTFVVPRGLSGKWGEDYHIYLLAEHVNEDNSTDYASEPVEVPAILQKIDYVAIQGIDAPKAETALDTEATISATDATAVLTWKKGETVATGNAEWKCTYQAIVTLSANKDYTFTDTTGITLNGKSVDKEYITRNNDGTLTIDCGTYVTATRKTIKIATPIAPVQFANYYTAENVLNSTELGASTKVTLEGTIQPNPMDMKVEWSLANENGAAYDATPTATNTFKWTINRNDYVVYDLNGVAMEGIVTIQNKSYTPVSIEGSDVTWIYSGNPTLDVSKYFTMDTNAEIATYEMQDTSTGTGTLKGSILTITTMGTFDIKASTPINGVYDKGEKIISIKVSKTTPYIKTAPTATAITYGDILSASALNGGAVQYGVEDDTTVTGTFTWKTPSVKPNVADSGKTEYVVIFTPTDVNFYNVVETRITLAVNKAEAAPNMPGTTMNTVYTNDTVEKVALPENWIWQESNMTKSLEVGKAVTATAIYNGEDKGNYVAESVAIFITRQTCIHTEKIEVKNAKEATCTAEGYTGDTFCKSCGTKIAEGIKIEKSTHTWDAGVVTKEATVADKGEKTYTCTACEATKIEEIPETEPDNSVPYEPTPEKPTTAKPTPDESVPYEPTPEKPTSAKPTPDESVPYEPTPDKTTPDKPMPDKSVTVESVLEIGTVIADDSGKAIYRVTSSDKTSKTVAYVKAVNKKAKNISIRATVVIKGVTYKVTAIEKNAFRKNKYLRKVTIGSNIETIGAGAFFKCKNLKNVSIKTKLLKKNAIGKNAFKGIKINATIKIPKKQFKVYKSMLMKSGVSKKAI